jgi:(E)-4-hydroxy-3-methylbut-2-enyl-diphosphate synthase
MDVAVIGCVVNGPGEAKEAAIGLTGGEPNLLYADGKPSHKVQNEDLVDELEKQIRQRIERQKSSEQDRVIPIKDIS